MQEPTSSRTAQRRRRSPAAARRGAAPRRGLGGALVEIGVGGGGKPLENLGVEIGVGVGGKPLENLGKSGKNYEHHMETNWKQHGTPDKSESCGNHA